MLDKLICEWKLSHFSIDTLLEIMLLLIQILSNAIQVSADQRQRLMMSTERLNRSSDRIRDSRKTMLETEDLGVSILQDLHQQRQSLLHAHDTVHHLFIFVYHIRSAWTNYQTKRTNRGKTSKFWYAIIVNIWSCTLIDLTKICFKGICLSLTCVIMKMQWSVSFFLHSFMEWMIILAGARRYWLQCQEGWAGINGSSVPSLLSWS